MRSSQLSGRCTPQLPAHAPHTVAIVGAGAAGTLVSVRLCEGAVRSRTALTVVLIDPAPTPGALTPFATQDPRHLLNVPAGKMSCDPDDPSGFVRWTAQHSPAPAGAGEFVPRGWFGAYLADTHARQVERARGVVTVRRVRATATGCRRSGETALLTLSDGSVLRADSVVVATGPGRPGTGWTPDALRESARFVADPWLPGALDGARAGDGDVLLVGTGLTAVDAALVLERAGRRVHAVSPSGRLPQTHAVRALPPVAPAVPPNGLGLPELRRAVLAHLRTTARTHGDWRPGLDGLRSLTAPMWQGLSAAERKEFLVRDVSWWNTHRHRMPPQSAEAVARLRRSGRLRVRAGRPVAVRENDGLLDVTLADGGRLSVRWVVNCTGPGGDDPFFGALHRAGLADPNPLGLGWSTASDGRLRGTDGAASDLLWTLGTHRRGELWESTALPEIREQASVVAGAVLDRAGRGRGRVGRRRPCDRAGLPVSASAEAAASYRRGLDALMKVRAGADRAFKRAADLDPGFALAHAALALLGHEGGADVSVPDALARARQAVRERGDERERALVEVIGRRITGPAGDGDAALLRHLDDHPRDILALSAAVPTIAFSGVTDLRQEATALVERTTDAHEGHWFHTSLLAFVRQEQGDFHTAGELALRSLADEPTAGNAAHALAHVHYETGAHGEGRRWLDGWIARQGKGTLHRAHFSWHAALHELALHDATAVQRRWTAQLAPSRVRGTRALVDSASLLWRAWLAECWPGPVPIDGVLAAVTTAAVERPVTPFGGLHGAVALAAAGDLSALGRLRQYAAGHGDAVFREVVAPLCGALTLVVEEQWVPAAAELRAVLPGLPRVGGSAAQREVVEETLLYALVRAGRGAAAGRLLTERLDRRPSPLDRHRLDCTVSGTGRSVMTPAEDHPVPVGSGVPVASGVPVGSGVPVASGQGAAG
ncbi:FAD/NAD(P)-binding protein [Streptomyces sp. NPDC091279]|uniref:FAD/NAD(P)-binding protein n=1 Tax=Streptomyces sp. NPDC091279 TaxID=3365983 RepID=UPI00381BCB9A